VIVVAAIAFLIGLGLMIFAIRNTPGWLGTGKSASAPAAPAAAPTPEAAPTATIAPSPVDPVTLATREAALAGQLASLEARAATVATDSQAAANRAGRAEGILVAFAARRAIDRGVGLGYLEEQLRQRFGATVPRETDTVIAAARAPVTAEDLRVGLETATPTLLAGDDDWWAGIGSELRNLVVIHKAGTPSPLPGAGAADAGRGQCRGGAGGSRAAAGGVAGGQLGRGGEPLRRGAPGARHAGGGGDHRRSGAAGGGGDRALIPSASSSRRACRDGVSTSGCPKRHLLDGSAYRSRSLGINSTKLQGRCRLSSWSLRMPSQPSFTAPVEPGSAKM
jgi:hypothetical protein